MADPIEVIGDLLADVGEMALDFLVYLISFVIAFAEGDYVSAPLKMTVAIIIAIATYILVRRNLGKGAFQ